MIPNRPEHRVGWRREFMVGEHHCAVDARHHTTRRPPRGHEIARQMARGKPWGMVEETEYTWAVVCQHRVLCTLRQHPNGTFYCGALPIPPCRMLEEAAKLAATRLLGGRIS